MKSFVQRRPVDCITDLRHDAWLSGELPEQELSQAQAHLADCSRCRERHAALAAQQEQFFARFPKPVLHPRGRVSSKLRKASFVLASVSLAAAAALAVFLPSAPHRESGVRAKGGAHIGFFVQRGASTLRAEPVYVVRPGDRIRFAYTSAEPAHLAIFGLDAANRASVYFPAGAHAQRIAAGADALLASSVELDALLGEETVHALFCPEPFALEPLRSTLERARELTPPPGCRMDTLTWRKEPAP